MSKAKYNRRTYQEVGEFKINPYGDAYVSDPGYDKPEAHAYRVTNVVHGEWIADININRYRFDIDGKRHDDSRVAQLFARAKGVDKLVYSGIKVHRRSIKYSSAWECLSNAIAVDSGQCGIFDYHRFGDCNCFETDGKCGFGDRWYSNLCDMTLGNHAGVFEYGVNASSGFGDGCYTLWGHKNGEGKYDALCVVFLGDNEKIDV